MGTGGRLDSVTNYQIYKALWSCLNDQNMYELSYNLNREYNSENGMYKESALYNFVDNHDVNRAVSALASPEQHIHLCMGCCLRFPVFRPFTTAVNTAYEGAEKQLRL